MKLSSYINVYLLLLLLLLVVVVVLVVALVVIVFALIKYVYLRIKNKNIIIQYLSERYIYLKDNARHFAFLSNIFGDMRTRLV